MPQLFHAYLPSRNLPVNADIGRALSSRGWSVELPESPSLCDTNGKFTITIDGQDINLEIGTAPVDSIAEAEIAKLGETAAKIMKTTDVRVSFSGTDDLSAKWSRDIARGVALLSLGAFHDAASGTTLHYGY